MNWATATDERLGALAERAAAWRRNGWISEEQKKGIETQAATGWRRHSLPLTITFFGLTCLGVAAFAIFLNLLHLPYGPITLVASIALAELLILKQHFQRTGVESALWISGLVACIFWLPSQNKPEAMLVFAAAFMVAGLRVRGALLIAGGAIFVVVYAAMKGHSFWPPIVVGLIITLLAGAALIAREWRHPWIEATFAVLAVVMPLAGYVSSMFTQHYRAPVAAVFAGSGIVVLAGGVLRRHRALLMSGAVMIAIAAFEIHERIDFPAEAKLILAGALVLSIAIALTRVLRGNTRGFVIDKVAERFEAMQIAGAIAIPSVAPAPSPAQPHPEPGGGSFGGGGATGDV